MTVIYDRRALTVSDGAATLPVSDVERAILDALTTDPGAVMHETLIADWAELKADWSFVTTAGRLRGKLRKLFGPDTGHLQNLRQGRWRWNGGIAGPRALIGVNLKLRTYAETEADLIRNGYRERFHGVVGDRRVSLYIDGYGHWTMLAKVKGHPETDVAVIGQGDYGTLVGAPGASPAA